MKTFKEYLNEAKFKVGDKVKEVEFMGQFKRGETLEIVQIKSGRIGVIAQGQNPKEVLFDDPKNFKIVNETEESEKELDEASFLIRVSVRDAQKANDLAADSYRGLYKNDGSDVFIYKKESDKEDFESELLDMKLEILDESAINEEDFSKIKPLMDKNIDQIRKNLFEDSKTISKVRRTIINADRKGTLHSIKPLQEVEQLMDKARQILTKIQL